MPSQIAKRVLSDWNKLNKLECYIDNLPVYRLFLSAESQWNVHGFSGAKTGLNYLAVEALMRLQRVRKKDRPKLFLDLQTIEHAALDAWAEIRKRS